MINRPLAQAFGKVLKELRDAKELSQEKLAFEAGLDRTYISMLERGMKQPTLTTIWLLASALDASMGEMVRVTESRAAPARARHLRAAEKPPATHKRKG